ncbi:MAG: cation:proton antiporter [Deltaproteobacteria bacterium]|nr:cation:proton antiporter [Deltaproteobacteria bacterium]
MLSGVFTLLSLAILLALFRLMRGPSLPDRVVALDLTATIVIGFIAVYAVATERPLFLDLAMVSALIVFIATVAFAYFIEKGTRPWPKS